MLIPVRSSSAVNPRLLGLTDDTLMSPLNGLLSAVCSPLSALSCLLPVVLFLLSSVLSLGVRDDMPVCHTPVLHII
jgi:hypothetical protein